MTTASTSASPQRYCQQCSARLKGRSDKRFCDSTCRTSYHNQQNRDQTNHIRAVNRILRKNRSILLRLIGQGASRVTHAELILDGFQITYCTHVTLGQDGRQHRYCYEVGLMELDHRLYSIVAHGSHPYGA